MAFVICLDTNYLIFALRRDSPECGEIRGWVRQGVPLITSTLAWFEFLNGPVSEKEIRLVRNLLREIVPLGIAETEAACRLFQSAGSKRSLKIDACIAGTAWVAGARIATRNREDFSRFPDVDLCGSGNAQ